MGIVCPEVFQISLLGRTTVTDEKALIKYETSRFLALSQDSEMAKVIKENMDGETFTEGDLVRVKTPSQGGVMWEIPGVAGVTHSRSIEGILVFQARQGTLWKSLDPGDDPPICVTRDMKYGRINVPEEKIDKEMLEELKKAEVPEQPGVVVWDQLPYTQFGSGKNGIGKFARESRPLFILREGEAYPLIIRAGSGSLKNIKQFLMQLTCEYFRAVISLTLTKEKSSGGIDYSQIHCQLKGVLSVEEGNVIKEMFTSKLKEAWNAGKYESQEYVAD
jgi:hypothetical protein